MKREPQISVDAQWLDKRGSFTHAVTINLKKRHPLFGTWISDDIAFQTASRFVRHLGRFLLKRKYRYGHDNINAVVTLERGSQFGRWHLHMALEKPINCSPSVFCKAIESVSAKLDWVRGDLDIRPYQSAGWMSYMIKGGRDSLVFIDTNK